MLKKNVNPTENSEMDELMKVLPTCCNFCFLQNIKIEFGTFENCSDIARNFKD